MAPGFLEQGFLKQEMTMCGVFGFITREGKGPDIARLRRLALRTQTRGEHAFGLAWLNHRGIIHTYKRQGPAQNYLDDLEQCRNAVVLVGHCRFATHGSPADNRNNHPHPAGRGEIVHNGVVFNHDHLVRHYSLHPQSQCDSEILGLLMKRCSGTVAQRAAWTANQTLGDQAILGVWRNPARLLIVRRGRPLCFGYDPDGCYLASLPEGLPGKVHGVADGSTCVMAYRNGQLVQDGQQITLVPEDVQLHHVNP